MLFVFIKMNRTEGANSMNGLKVNSNTGLNIFNSKLATSDHFSPSDETFNYITDYVTLFIIVLILFFF